MLHAQKWEGKHPREDLFLRMWSRQQKSPGTSVLLHDFIISFLPSPISVPISPNFLHDCGLPLPSPKPWLTSRTTAGASVGQEESVKAPFAPGAVVHPFLGFSPDWPRLQAGLSAFLKWISVHSHAQPTSAPGAQPYHPTRCLLQAGKEICERCEVISALGSLSRMTYVSDRQPGRTPCLLFISLSFHPVLIIRTISYGINISYSNIEDSAHLFSYEPLLTAVEPVSLASLLESQRFWVRQRCC